MTRKTLIAGAVWVLAGCGGGDAETAPPPIAAGFPPAQPEGYVRYTAEPVDVAPGQDLLLAQWVAPPTDQELDVLDIVGGQTASGHHALLYATTMDEPVGTTRTWEDADQLATRFLGGVGGEAGGNVKLPPGVVFRVPAGRGLLMQTHYLNASPDPIRAESVLDVKFAPASPDRQLASMFANTTLAIDLPPNQASSIEVECEVNKDLRFVMFSNHMHELGVDTLTERVETDGAASDIKRDDAWKYEWAFNPNFSQFDPSEPFVVSAGTKIRTGCSWNNSGPDQVAFPREMCVFFGFFLAEKDVNCVNGLWSE